MRWGSLLLFAAVGAGVYLLASPRVPKTQQLNIVLGSAAPEITDVRVHYGARDADKSEWTRDVELHFETGQAPRVVHHEVRLPDGEYVVGLDVRGARGSFTDERRVDLHASGSTSIDVSEGARSAMR